MNRREFCKKGLLVAGGLAVPLSALELFNPKRLLAEKDDKGKTRWVFLVDTHKCVGCGFCVKACKTRKRGPLRRQCHPHLGRALRHHQGWQDSY